MTPELSCNKLPMIMRQGHIISRNLDAYYVLQRCLVAIPVLLHRNNAVITF